MKLVKKESKISFFHFKLLHCEVMPFPAWLFFILWLLFTFLLDAIHILTLYLFRSKKRKKIPNLTNACMNLQFCACMMFVEAQRKTKHSNVEYTIFKVEIQCILVSPNVWHFNPIQPNQHHGGVLYTH